MSSILEIRFSELKQYKCECKSALVRPLFLTELPDLHISTEVNKGL
jgi:hypothetical protein